MNSFPAVQSVARAFSLLAEINRIGNRDGGQSAQADPHSQAYHRAAAGNPDRAGYVFKDHRMGGYQVTSKARRTEFGLSQRAAGAGSRTALGDRSDATAEMAHIALHPGRRWRGGALQHHLGQPDLALSFHHRGEAQSGRPRHGPRLSVLLSRKGACHPLRGVEQVAQSGKSHWPRGIGRIVAVAQRNGFAERDRKVEPSPPPPWRCR